LPPPLFLEQFQQISFFRLHTYLYSICTIFTLLHHFSTSSPLPLVPSPKQNLFCSLILRFCIRKEKGKNEISGCLR
jgi:hypothetical protein